MMPSLPPLMSLSYMKKYRVTLLLIWILHDKYVRKHLCWSSTLKTISNQFLTWVLKSINQLLQWPKAWSRHPFQQWDLKHKRIPSIPNNSLQTVFSLSISLFVISSVTGDVTSFYFIIPILLPIHLRLSIKIKILKKQFFESKFLF